jgi:hypothetical protein
VVGLEIVVDEVEVEQGLDDAGDEGGDQHVLPMIDPGYVYSYQWKM